MKYMMVRSSVVDHFQSEVNTHIKLGWVLQGGVSVTQAADGRNEYFQAMTYKEPSKPFNRGPG
jgi:hypothetical protein